MSLRDLNCDRGKGASTSAPFRVAPTLNFPRFTNNFVKMLCPIVHKSFFVTFLATMVSEVAVSQLLCTKFSKELDTRGLENV